MTYTLLKNGFVILQQYYGFLRLSTTQRGMKLLIGSSLNNRSIIMMLAIAT